MWLKFTSDFSWRQPGFTIAYKAGMTRNVTRACADAAMKAGKAEPREAADEPPTRWLTGDEALAAMGDWGDLEAWKTRIDEAAGDKVAEK